MAHVLDFALRPCLKVDQRQRAAWTLAALPPAVDHASTGVAYLPEASPFTTLFVDLTHRCNMACRNCYIPNRDIPDMDPQWLYGILGRLPRRTRIRLVGAEPTVRDDLPEIIREIRRLGHLPVLMTNGLRLKKANYARELRAAGLRTAYLSMNGGLDDELYVAIDELRCAAAKRAALDNLCAAGINVTVGMILVRDLNLAHVGTFWRHLASRPHVRDVHFRSVGQMGRHMDGSALRLDEMTGIVLDALGADESQVEVEQRDTANFDFRFGGRKFVITQWPDLGSRWRGRLTPDGTVEPCFEHLIANAARGGY